MSSETLRYLDLIGEHLREGHASVLVGAGFSRNAVKIDEKLKSSPTWAELAQVFIDKLATETEERKRLMSLSPLVLAERVEAIYGRSELDHLLLSSIRDADFRPSSLHHKLLELPWSDVFTTNYDTLLERASEELTERQFAIITCKEDLVGSSGSTRIIKLHGSFPSHRPFIITSEDYRTYPRAFAPFVNTVQQSMLENTLCLIGFSGDDPNFEQWIGWIRDNLGTDNSPNIYLLLHYAPSEAERKLLARRKIIPVDLSQTTENQDISTIYETALDRLIEHQQAASIGEWELSRFISGEIGHSTPIRDALDIVQEIHRTYPGWITVPEGRLELLRAVTTSAMSALAIYAEDTSQPDLDILYLYECDWLREKTLLPPSSYELRHYDKILERHPEGSFYKYSVQLSLLRNLRECGRWETWDALYKELQMVRPGLTADQIHQLQWEGCLCTQARYHFRELKQRLENWKVDSNMPVWILRKAGLLAEFGAREEAQVILQQAILDVRQRLAHRQAIDLTLLSLESAMMFLQGFISDALDHYRKGKDVIPSSVHIMADRRHRALHDQYHVNWETQNISFLARLEAPWRPYHTKHEQSSFDFGKARRSSHFGADVELIRAYSFLRFREEIGIPFFINSVHNGSKAACGAAERIARYTPLWSVLTLVRTDEPKSMEQTITRGILSSWTQETADQYGLFYLNALLETEAELSADSWFFRESFAHLAAEVLPEILSELCAKCSISVLNKILSALRQLYESDKKSCYPQMKSLVRRLVSSYPLGQRQELIEKCLAFPIIEGDRLRLELPDPISFIPIDRLCTNQEPENSIPAVGQLFDQYENSTSKKELLNRLLHCLCHGLLTPEQKEHLRSLLWTNRDCFDSVGWLRTICLELPSPENINVPRHLAETFTREAHDYGEKNSQALSDLGFLREIGILSEKAPGIFTEKQISTIVLECSSRMCYLSSCVLKKSIFLSIQLDPKKEMYEIAQMLWVLTVSHTRWTASDTDLQYMRDILKVCQEANVHHCGLECVWGQRLGNHTNMAKEFSNCFRASDELCIRWGFETLATALLHPELSLLDDTAICAGMELLAQQIVWGVPQLLTSALQAAKIAVDHRSELVSNYVLEPIVTGLSRLEQQTRITIDDTAEAACDKGNIRVYAAILAKTLHDTSMCGDRPEVLENWLTVINDTNEFAEIRNAL